MSSKMLDVYVSEIGRLIDSGLWNEAETAAASLPHIAVALSNADLASSGAEYRDWCRAWIRPSREDAVYDGWHAATGGDTAQATGGRAIPKVLQALSLRRRLRPAVAHAPREMPADPRARAVTEVCGVLIAGFQMWRETREKSDPVVQMNLAKLGVLR
jgi:hypothetical protein